jgi:hypothetical protein
MEKTKLEIRPSCKDCIHSDSHVTANGSLQMVCAYEPPISAYAVISADARTGNVAMFSQALWPPVQPNWRCAKLEVEVRN